MFYCVENSPIRRQCREYALISDACTSQDQSPFASLIHTTEAIALGPRDKSGSFSISMAEAIWTSPTSPGMFAFIAHGKTLYHGCQPSRPCCCLDAKEHSACTATHLDQQLAAQDCTILRSIKISQPKSTIPFQIRTRQEHNSLGIPRTYVDLPKTLPKVCKSRVNQQWKQNRFPNPFTALTFMWVADRQRL